MKIQKIISVALILALCLSILAGCNDVSAPKNASELISRSNEAMSKVDNYKADMNMKVEIGVSSEADGAKIDAEVPITMDMSFDVSGDYMHGKADMEMKMDATVEYGGESEKMNESFESDIEMYYVMSDGGKSVTMYSNTDDEGWQSEEKDSEDVKLDAAEIMSAISESSVFENAKMEKSDGVYTVSVPLADMLSDEAFVELMEDSMASEDMDIGDIDWDDFAEAVGDAVVIYTFDAKNYNLLGMQIDKVEIDTLDFVSDSSVEDLIGMNIGEITMTMKMNITFSDFGKVNEKDVIVPDDVVSDAVEDIG